MFPQIPFRRVNWLVSSFPIGTLFLSVTAVPLYLWFFGIDCFQIVLFFAMLGACGFSITLGYHRLFSHLTFQAHWIVRFFTVVFGAGAFENSVLLWSSEHRDEKELWKHRAWIIRVSEVHNGILRLCGCCKEVAIAWSVGKNMRNGMERRNALTQCRMVSASVGTGDRSGAIMMEADGLLLNRPDTASAFGDTAAIPPRLFASVRIYPGAKSNVSPIFSWQWK
jgi:hypothetical protein